MRPPAYQTATPPAIDDGTAARVAADLIAAWNAHDVERVMSHYAPHYEGIDVGQAHPEHGLEGKRNAVLVYLRAFPDLNFSIEQVVIQGSEVAVRWTASGTHQGSFMHIPQTGRSMRTRGVSMLTLDGEKVVQAAYIWDVAGLLREIGLLPEL
jgi:steroid delta-isomerase-like uncharacterized protein